MNQPFSADIVQSTTMKISQALALLESAEHVGSMAAQSIASLTSSALLTGRIDIQDKLTLTEDIAGLVVVRKSASSTCFADPIGGRKTQDGFFQSPTASSATANVRSRPEGYVLPIGNNITQGSNLPGDHTAVLVAANATLSLMASAPLIGDEKMADSLVQCLTILVARSTVVIGEGSMTKCVSLTGDNTILGARNTRQLHRTDLIRHLMPKGSNPPWWAPHHT